MIAALALIAATGAANPAAAPGAGDWRLVWSDEFDGPAIDRDKWDYDVDCWGGGNHERQCYTDRPENAAIEDGRLVITARRERFTGPALPLARRGDAAAGAADTATRDFTSARLVTRGKASWTYAKIEVRAKLPQGQGTWPAIWMLPDDDHYGAWAASGEIDLLEAVNLGVPCATCEGGVENHILGTLHFGGTAPDNTHKGAETALPGPLGGWHVFGLIWRPERIEWTIDGRLYATQVAGDWHTAASRNPAAPFDRPFHLILNLAIGGGLAESRGTGGVDARDYPKRFEIDWVRVWQCDDEGASTASCNGAGK